MQKEPNGSALGALSGGVAIPGRYSRHGGVFVELPDMPDGADELSQSMLAAVKEFGDLAGVAAQDVADGKITRAEMAEIEREGYEAVAAITAFLELCRDRAQR